MRTKKRFFLKAAGISPAKAVGISLAFVLAFAMAFAACDTGTSNGGSRSPDTGTDPDYAVPVNRTFKNGNVELAITESGGVIYYKLKVAGTEVSYGTATAGATAWTFSSYKGQSFSIPVSGSGDDLAFGAATITADDGTEIPIPALTLAVGSEEKVSGGPPVITVSSEKQLYNALNTKVNDEYRGGVYRITTSPFNLTEPLDVHTGQHIVVGGSAVDGEIGQYSAGGPLFTMTGSSKTFNIGAKLTLESGATLTIAGGAAVNATGGGELYVSGGAKVGVGVDVTEEEGVNIGTGLSALCVDGGTLNVKNGATLAVTNNPAASVNNPLASKVRQENTANSKITIETGVTLAITLTVAAGDDENEEAAKIIGNSGNEVIVIPSDEFATGASAAIGAVEVTVDGEAADTELKTAVNTAAGTTTAASPAKTTGTNTGGTEVQSLLDGAATTVIYSGDDALGSITIPDGKTLIISGDVTNQADAIGGTGTLQITGSVSLATSVTDPAILQSLVKASGGGKVVLNSDVTVSGEFDVNLTLEIAEGAKLTFSEDEQINVSGTIVNHGTISSAKEGIVNAMLVDNLKQFGGTFELTAAQISVTATYPLTIPENTTLKLSGTATLTVTGTLTVQSGAFITGEVGVAIEVEGTGRINGDGATNFYYNDSTTAITVPIPAGTYNWNATAGGAGTPGWKSDEDAPVVPPPAQPAGTAEQVRTYLADGIPSEITYTGSDPLAGADNADLDVPSGKTLIITGTINNQAKKITTSGGTITNNGIINTATSGITADILANLVGIPTTASGKVVLKAAVTGVEAPLTLGADLDIIAVDGRIEFTGSGAAFSGGKTVTNDGTITTATNDEGVLRALVGLAGTSGTVSWNGTELAPVAVTLEDDLTLSTQNLSIEQYATLNLATFALTEGEGEVVNIGMIKTAATTKTALDAILAFYGIIEIGNFTVVGAEATETLTVPANTTLIVPNNVTLTLGSENYAGTLILAQYSSKLVLEAGGKVNAAHTDSTVVGTDEGDETDVKVTVGTTAAAAFSPTYAKPTGSNGTNWVLVTDAETGEAVDIILGKLKISITADATTPVTGADVTDVGGTAAPGSLKAGDGTTIKFEGSGTG